MSIDFNFNNSYLSLPNVLYTEAKPEPVLQPETIFLNHRLSETLGLELSKDSDSSLAQTFSGNCLPKGAAPLAQAYAGHQFGHFTMLGDGRAHLIGEHIAPDNKRCDIQLKGSGRTPYSRRGDGRAALGPMLREVIISEAIHHLGIASTRSLAVVTTGEPVYRDTKQPGAILTRVAASHIRVGTFEYLAARRDTQALKQLADYSIARHHPALSQAEQPYLSLLLAVMETQIALVTDWMRVGFIHGVMNTDNVAISGETIDYGPCAFMDTYDPETVFSSIDHNGRYAFANQAKITAWNMARFAEAILPLLHQEQKQAVSIAEEALQSFDSKFQTSWLSMMRCKLGLIGEQKDDLDLIQALLDWMHHQRADYTNTFRALCTDTTAFDNTIASDNAYQTQAFQDWHNRWQQRITQGSEILMRENNPAIIPRNHHVEAALILAQDGDYSKLYKLLEVITKPYEDKPMATRFSQPPEPHERIYQTFCGT